MSILNQLPGPIDWEGKDKDELALYYMDMFISNIPTAACVPLTADKLPGLNPNQQRQFHSLRKKISELLILFDYVSRSNLFEVWLTPKAWDAKAAGGHFAYLKSLRDLPIINPITQVIPGQSSEKKEAWHSRHKELIIGVALLLLGLLLSVILHLNGLL